jgi:hypothetical protein
MQVKGNIPLARKAFVTKHFEAEGRDRVLEAIPQEDRDQLEGCLANVCRSPFGLRRRLDESTGSLREDQIGLGSGGPRRCPQAFPRSGNPAGLPEADRIHPSVLLRYGPPKGLSRNARHPHRATGARSLGPVSRSGDSRSRPRPFA